MSFGGFGKSSGPSAPPRAQTPFGHFPRPPSPSPPRVLPLPFDRSPDFPSSNKRPAVPYLPQSPPVVFQNNINVGSQHPASEVQQSSDFPSSNKGYMVPYRPGSPPVGFQNNINIGGISPANEVQQRPLSSPVWGNQPKTYIQNSVRPAQESNSSVSRGGGTYQSGFIFHTKPMDVPLQKRSRSPVFLSTRGASPENSVFPSEGHRRSLIDYTDLDAPEALSSPPLSFKRSVSSAHAPRPFPGTQKSFSSPSWVNQLNSSNNANPPVQEDTSPVVTTRETYQLGRTLQTGRAEGPLPKRTRSPTLPSTVGAFSQNSVSASDGLKRAPDSHSHRETKHNGVEVARDNPMHIKRTKLQLQSSTDQVFHENVDSSQETERELHAKAKRLARFKDELSQPMQGHSTVRSQKVPAKMPQPLSEKQKFSEDPRMDVTRNSAGANVFQDHEGVASSSSIVGLCPDMCPESERTERGRKGDLDQYERVDGDRNLTSEVLAVKKYNRTAEREADLIRPMPILQKTMDYLLNLLDQPYDDRFLGLYNFLWDRMRAIRMDLRMQHIFNLEAISMLEQMIRLHIIAMHEFCEYTKGEGFSEGFDGHLNIEQMNKTSVELFQLYDDHRKKGRHVPSEREFRGYYALLKLDKHPGYKVEPAELSLDLAKMTPEVRQTPEVLFARDVARACRTGNFIAFFRLARKATYLQACLMHAHFSKLRTLALGSLHSGLQVNQGIPVAQVAKWLGMEEEDIETLLEHHGFSVKDFEEPYMVKENAFINADEDFPVKRSQLVMRKRSMMIVSDVSFPSLSELHTTKEVKEFQLQKDPELTPKPAKALGPLDNVHPPHVEARDLPTISSPKGSIQKPMHEISTDVVTPHEKMTRPEIQLAPVSPLILDSSISSSNQSRVESATRSLYDPVFRNSFGRKIKHGVEETIPIPLEMAEEEGGHILPLDSVVDTPIPELMLSEDLENQELVGTMEEDQFDEVTTSYYDKEVAEGKLKLILRLWKRRAAKKRGWRENKQIAASAALNLLSVGPPIWQYEIQSGNYDMFNIDHVMSERHEIQEKSWSLLNPSDVVAATLADKNRDAKCLCWKLLLCSQATSAACSWLHSKFMPTENDSDDNLLVSSPDLAIWRSWIPSQSGVDTCCLSIIKSATFNELNKSVSGVSAILFLLAEHIPMQIQKKQLHDLVVLLPCGSHLPLLILSGSSKDDSDPSTIAKELGLQDIDKSRVSISYIVFLKDKEIKKLDGFFSSERLIEGLEWLASESPPQIIVSKMKARGLVQSHLNPTLEVLGEHGIGPNHCISVFNEALDRSMKEISAAANSNPTGWPCPEIDLLDKYSDEYRAIAWNLPSTGWSLASRIESLICSLNNLKLPTFDDDLSWLSKGLDIGVDIEFQKSRLENCLTNYLTNTCQMIGVAFARKEANIMLQKCTRLELHNATYHIVPKWVHIFRRICSWLLMNLTSGEVSSTYVLVQNHIAAPEDKPEPEFSTSPCPYIVEPSLDELFEVSCHELGPSGMESGVYERLLPMPMDVARLQTSNDDVTLMESESETAQDSISTSYVDSLTEVKNDGVRMMPTKKATKEADRISELLEKCNLMQNLIDKKLSIYF